MPTSICRLLLTKEVARSLHSETLTITSIPFDLYLVVTLRDSKHLQIGPKTMEMGCRGRFIHRKMEKGCTILRVVNHKDNVE